MYNFKRLSLWMNELATKMKYKRMEKTKRRVKNILTTNFSFLVIVCSKNTLPIKTLKIDLRIT